MSGDDMLGAMGESAAALAQLTGMKQQLVDQGWSERAAEQVVIAILQKG